MNNEHPSTFRTPPLPSHPHLIIALLSIRFAPFQDTLALDNSLKLSTMLVPGSGESNFYCAESDPFKNEKPQMERELRAPFAGYDLVEVR